MNTAGVIEAATGHITQLPGHIFDLLTLTKPTSPEAALNLAKVISKLSPLLGNLIEFNMVELLNAKEEFHPHGTWHRQDPGFPDTVFRGTVAPTPGLEIKAWFPLATEITARFKDSQNHFRENNTYVAMLAWLPEKLIYGKPYIIDAVVVPALSVAASRDEHYHNPPDYLVLEPGDTAARTRNLQQTNTNGYKFQGTSDEFAEAERIVAGWGTGRKYEPTIEYQRRLRELTGRFTYRLDTNFAKMDRIAHPEIERFKRKVCDTLVNGLRIREWSALFGRGNDAEIETALSTHLDIRREDAEKLVR